MSDRKIYVIYGKQAQQMTLELLEAAHVADEIPVGASIALKPNLVIADDPENGATTHAGVVEGVIAYLQAHGHTRISIIEGSWLGDRTERAFALCGYNEISKRHRIPVYDLKKDASCTVKTQVGDMRICERALRSDYLINLPVLKGHCQTLMTCALKNMKGCIPDGEKRHFHTMGLHQPIAALNAVLKPSLTIVDNICGDLNFEEGGNPVQTHRMYLGHDPVQIDAFGCHLMGINANDVDYIGYAERWGVGSRAFSQRDIVYLNAPTAAKEAAGRQGTVARLGRNVRSRSACSACYASLIRALYQFEEREGRAFPGEIHIGQDYAGQAISGMGIGKCCKGADAHVPGCPPSVEAIYQMLQEMN